MMMSAPRSGFHFYAVTLVDPLTVSDSNSPPSHPASHMLSKNFADKRNSIKNVKKKSLMGCERWSAERTQWGHHTK